MPILNSINQMQDQMTEWRQDLHKIPEIGLQEFETSKYIRPNEGTVDYAYMFIPADGLYQDLLNNKVGSLKINQRDLVSYAYQKKVMIVSPMSLFPMLQVTSKALNNMKVEESIQEIQINIEKLGNHLKAYLTYQDLIFLFQFLIQILDILAEILFYSL